jgi:hypothetical protein
MPLNYTQDYCNLRIMKGGFAMERMPLEVQNLYTELLDRLSVIDARRSIGHVPGTFVTKMVKGEVYYYFQYSEPGGSKRQLYIGRKDSSSDKLVKSYQEARAVFEEDAAGIQRLCALLRAGGALLTDSASARVLRALSDGGVFRLDGVLVGTHAFLALGNVLGVRWDGGSIRTQDIDIDAEPTLSVAFPGPGSDIPGVLEELQMGFLPVPQLDPRKPSTSFVVRGKGLRLDLLTPLRGRRVQKPVFIPRLKAAAQAVPFLDFLIKRPVRGAIVDSGGVLVNVPDPARFAIHKLIVSGEREAVMHTRREKDLNQAAQVFSILLEDRPGDIKIAWKEIRGHGKGWVKRVQTGVSALKRLTDPVVGGKIADYLK